MNKNFMIGFMHDGDFYCANVHKHLHESAVQYHVTVLTSKTKSDIPSRIILENKGRGVSLISYEAVPAVFLETILAEIHKHDNKAN